MTQQPYLLVAGIAIVAVITAVAIFICFLDRAERHREKLLRELSREFGLAHTNQGQGLLAAHRPALKEFKLLARSWDLGVHHVLSGKYADGTVTMFELLNCRGIDDSQTTDRVAAILLTFQGTPLPEFVLRPEGTWDMVADWFGFDDIDFQGHLAFSALCHLSGRNEGEIRHLFTSDVIELIERHMNHLFVEAKGQMLLLYYPGRLTPLVAHELLATRSQLLQLLRQGPVSSHA